MKRLILIIMIGLNFSIYSNPVKERYKDPAVDRNLITPTAQTLKKGTFSVGNYDIAGFSVTYAFTDSLQGTIGMGLVTPYIFSLKFKLFETENMVLSTTAGVAPYGNFDTGSIGAGGGIILDLVPSEWVSFSFILLGAVYKDKVYSGEYEDDIEMNKEFVLGGGVAVNLKLSNFVRFIFALNYQNYDTSLTPNYDIGLRFHGENLAVEVGLVGGAPAYKTTYDYEDDEPQYAPDLSGLQKVGLPYLSFTYRF